ncbi:Cellulase-9, endo-1,4-beta-glucanase, partial [Globisporangium splendens]
MHTRWLGVIAALVASADVSLAANTTSTTSSTFINFRSVNGKLLADGETFYIKGINWFGFETIEGVVQGLWPSATTIETALDTLVENDFNAVRLPLALDSVINDPDVSNDQTAGTTALAGKTYLEVLDYFVNEARKRNILVLLDSHRIEAAEPDFPDVAEPAKITPALEKLATRYCNNPATWNVFGIDIKNEPKGTATWGSGDEATDWRLAAATIGNAVLAKCARMLIFVEGVQTNIKGSTVSWGQAGGSLQGAKDYPVKLKNMERLVYSPHVISPGVDFKSPWWTASTFPKNMIAIWDEYFGSVPTDTGNAVVVGAWGAKMTGNDLKWANTLATYLSDNSIGSFYWAFNPQSADTGGFVMDDWRTPVEERVELLEPLPSTPLDNILKKYAECATTCAGNGNCCEICTAGDREACGNDGICQEDSTCLCDAGVNGKYCGGADCGSVNCGDSKNAGCVDGDSAELSSGSSGATILCDTCPALVVASHAAALVAVATMNIFVSALVALFVFV